MVSTARPFRPFFLFFFFLIPSPSFLPFFFSFFFFLPPLHGIFDRVASFASSRFFDRTESTLEEKDDTFSGKRPPVFRGCHFCSTFLLALFVSEGIGRIDTGKPSPPSCLFLLPRVLFQSLASTKVCCCLAEKPRGRESQSAGITIPGEDEIYSTVVVVEFYFEYRVVPE